MERLTQYNFSPAECAFSNHVLAHLKNFSSVIDITRFMNSQRWDIDKVIALYMEVLWNNPAIFHVAKTVEFKGKQYSDGSMRYAKLTGIRYAFPKEQYQENKLKLDAEVKKALACAAGESAPEMIALRLHDYIVDICDYDTDAAKRHDTSPLARTVYSVLVRKRAVCEGYTMAYRYLLQKFNILSEEIVSDKMNHCWNYVNIRGRWYHVDVTYDDPVFISAGGTLLGKFLEQSVPRTISRKHFLMSDDKARRTDHSEWETKGLPPALDRSYDDKNWR